MPAETNADGYIFVVTSLQTSNTYCVVYNGKTCITVITLSKINQIICILTHYLTAQQHFYACPVHTIISDMISPSA